MWLSYFIDHGSAPCLDIGFTKIYLCIIFCLRNACESKSAGNGFNMNNF